MGTFILILIIAAIVIGVAMEISKRSKMTPDQLKDYEDGLKWGPVSPAYICPHCQTKGFVRTMPVKRKKGISGAKATGALLTAGVSILATGLSRKEGQLRPTAETAILPGTSEPVPGFICRTRGKQKPPNE